MFTRIKGFTLIELLIVVAIIAILAAIAVPNFLEAQTRAKVSRVKADQRSMATALEAYYIDNNAYPAAANTTTLSPASRGAAPAQTTPYLTYNSTLLNASNALKDLSTFLLKQSATDNLMTLTTPVSFITSYFSDPFASTPGATFTYYRGSQRSDDTSPATTSSTTRNTAEFLMASFGPNTDETPGPSDIAGSRNTGCPTLIGRSTNFSRIQRDDIRILSKLYDPTNGTISSGDVVRIKD